MVPSGRPSVEPDLKAWFVSIEDGVPSIRVGMGISKSLEIGNVVRFSGGEISMATDIVAYGIYADRASFDSAIEALRAANFRNSDISVVLPERDRTTRDLAQIHPDVRAAASNAAFDAA